MSNLKISQLPVYTGTTNGSWLIANNSGQTETFKIVRENFLSGYATSTDVTALSSSIASAGYATTGSNTFIGTETISGSVIIQGSGNTALNVNGGNSLFSGSIIINGSSAAGSKFLLFSNASGSVGASVVFIPSTIPSLSISAGAISGSVSIGTLQSGINTLFGDTRLTGSAHNITGSLGIRGNVQITGSLTQTGSLTVSGSAHKIVGDTTLTGSLTVSGSIYQTGSVQGNVNALSISSNTASLNLDNGNFFTLQLVSGSATHLNPSNIKPGQTVSVFVNTISGSSITFPSSIKQTSSDPYIPTSGTALDILTLISKDTSNLYLVNAKNFV